MVAAIRFRDFLIKGTGLDVLFPREPSNGSLFLRVCEKMIVDIPLETATRNVEVRKM
jgi:hypothetical protein